MVFWSFKTFSPNFAAELSAIDRISSIETKLECVYSPNRDISDPCDEVAVLGKLTYSFLNAAETGLRRNRNDSPLNAKALRAAEK